MKTTKSKEPVRLRFKPLANGNQSIYLDTYRNGVRTYEFLKLYLVPPTTPIDKESNRQTMAIANSVKAQRILQLERNEAGLPNTKNGKILFVDYINTCASEKEAQGNHRQANHYRQTAKIAKAYKGNKIKLCDINKEYCKGLLNFMAYEYTLPNGNHYKQGASYSYMRIFKAILNKAYKAGYIANNPFNQLDNSDKIKNTDSTVIYLTMAEVKSLMQTPCKYKQVKLAYLFSCFCGLRYSDVEKLQWSNIEYTPTGARLQLRQTKTRNNIYIPFTKALEFLPDKTGKSDSDKVFKLPNVTTVETTLKNWADVAGIKNKNVTFHTARHTFATSLLEKGADLYTVSKLLGHTNIQNTQIYAKVTDNKKNEAMALFNDF